MAARGQGGDAAGMSAASHQGLIPRGANEGALGRTER